MFSLGSERIKPEHFGIVSVSAVRHAMDRVRLIERFLRDDVGIDMQFWDWPTSTRQKAHHAEATRSSKQLSQACQLLELEFRTSYAHRSMPTTRRSGALALGSANRSTLIGVAGNYRRFMGPNYRRGYMGRDYHVTGEHEAEAKAAERAKKPTRIGHFVLRLLGYKGPVHQPLRDIRRVTPSRMHPHRDPG